MGDHQTGRHWTATLGEHVRAIRYEATQVGTAQLRTAALEARERRSQLSESLPEGIVEIDLTIADRLKRVTEAAPPSADSSCDMAWSIAIGCFHLADEAADSETADFYTSQGYHYLGVALDCE